MVKKRKRNYHKKRSTNLIKKYKGKRSHGLFGEIGRASRDAAKERIERLKEERKEKEEKDVHGMKVGKTKREHTHWYWR